MSLEQFGRTPGDLEKAVERHRERGRLEVEAATLAERCKAFGVARRSAQKLIDAHTAALERFEKRKAQDDAELARLQSSVQMARKARQKLAREFPESKVGQEVRAEREAAFRTSKVECLRRGLMAVDRELRAANAKAASLHVGESMDFGLSRTMESNKSKRATIVAEVEQFGEPVDDPVAVRSE